MGKWTLRTYYIQLPLNVHPVLNTLNEDIVIRLKSLEAHIVSLRVFKSCYVQ